MQRLIIAALALWAGSIHALPQESSPQQPALGAAKTSDTQIAAPVETLTIAFRQLGSYQPAQLRGIDGHLDLPLGLRGDRLVESAELTLRFSYSPALLPDLSHLRVSLNGETIGTIALPRETAGRELTQRLTLDPRYFSDYNQLRVQLIGHYTLQCEDPLHSSLWATISPDSQLRLQLRQLDSPNDLARLPAPFFDRRDGQPLNLPFVFPPQPSLETLRSAAVLASWFGAQASYRGATFPTRFGELPLRHAVLFSTNGSSWPGLELPAVEKPTLSLISHPQQMGIKLLLIQGKDDGQLRNAVEALVLGQAVLTGSQATIAQVNIGERRLAYDAPLWLRTDRPVKFGELVEFPTDLQSTGLVPYPLRVNLRLPPDLLTRNRKGVPVDLRYRYTAPLEKDNSLLSISINDQFIQSFRLLPNQQTGGNSKLLVPLLDQHRTGLRDEFVIPAFQVGADNQLQFQFALDYHRKGPCEGSTGDLARAAIDPESTVDLRGFPHYTAMPNLALFANAGFPFTKYADLAETLVVMPDVPDPRSVETLLSLMGRFGRQTGATALRVQLAKANALPSSANLDLLVIDNPEHSAGTRTLLSEWQEYLPVQMDATQRSYRPRPVARWFSRSDTMSPDNLPTQWQVVLSATGPLSALLAFESPYTDERSIVVLTGTSTEAVSQWQNLLADPALVQQLRGDVVLARGNQLASYQGATQYFTGELPWLWALWFFLGRHPLLVMVLAIAASLVGAALVHRYLKSMAARRLGGEAT